MSDTLLDHQASVGPALISSVAAMSAEERRAFLDGAFGRMKAAQGEIVAALGEVERGQDYRDEGATSVEAWVVQRYGLSVASARGLVQPAKVAWDIPHLVGSLYAGDLSLDKLRAVADVATPETDRSGATRPRGAQSLTWPRWPAPGRRKLHWAIRLRRRRLGHRAITIDVSCASTTSIGR